MQQIYRSFDRIGIREMVDMLGTIPPHNPDRHTAIDGCENSWRTNGMRASAARAAIACLPGCPIDEVRERAADLFTNLIHLAHSSDIQLSEFVQSGLMCFLLEAGDCVTKDGD